MKKATTVEYSVVQKERIWKIVYTSNQIMETKNLEKILSSCSRILKHQKEIEVLKGENFNIFSILKMESKENATHSAFLGELLNPKGSHSKGTTFLKLFLETIKYNQKNNSLEGSKGKLNSDKAYVKLEYIVGSVDVKTKTKSGGRIDIYIFDDKGNSISIENKIYARDQKAQIERYCNHNKEKNTVYYLTLQGEDASLESRGVLKDGIDYHCISYADHIVKWLEDCLKEATDHPILRESIKQYVILIKKLTNQLTNHKMEKEIQDLIVKNYKSARTIASNVGKVELDVTYSFLLEVKAAIEVELTKDWTVKVDDDLNKSYTGLRISNNTWSEAFIKLEGCSKVPWNESIYGIHSHKNKWNNNILKEDCNKFDLFKEGFKSLEYWPYYKSIMSLSRVSERARLFNDDDRKALITEVSQKLIELVQLCDVPLKNKLKSLK
jgi:hypothetical protein